jgi:hypothetical protein
MYFGEAQGEFVIPNLTNEIKETIAMIEGELKN